MQFLRARAFLQAKMEPDPLKELMRRAKTRAEMEIGMYRLNLTLFYMQESHDFSNLCDSIVKC